MHVPRADAPRLITLREVIPKAFNYIIKAREKVLGGAGCRWLSVNECWVGWFIKRKRLDIYLRGSPLRWKLQQPLLELFNEQGMSNVNPLRIIPITKWTSVQSSKCNQAQVIKIHGKTPIGAATIVSIIVCAPMQGRGLLPVVSSVCYVKWWQILTLMMRHGGLPGRTLTMKRLGEICGEVRERSAIKRAISKNAI